MINLHRIKQLYILRYPWNIYKYFKIRKTFPVNKYLAANPDVEKQINKINPIVHYVRYGIKEHRILEKVMSNGTINTKLSNLFLLNYYDILKILNNKEIKIVSFDIFDTLLIRPSLDPKDLFILFCKYIEKKYKINIYKYRINAEKELNKKDCNIEDIYKYVVNKLNLKNEMISTLTREEVDFEKQILTPRKDVVDFLKVAREQGKIVVGTTDMYLSKDNIKEILIKNNIKLDSIYVSNELGERKDDAGKLYLKILKDYNVKANEIVHIGDNYQSDYINSLQVGICGIYYPSIKDLIAKTESPYHILSEKYEHLDWCAKLILGFSVNQHLNSYKMYRNQDGLLCNQLSFENMYLFPIILSLVLKLHLNPEIQKFDTVYFAARDGYLPKKIYDKLSENIFKDSISSKYLFLSRRSYIFLLEDNIYNICKGIKCSDEFTINNFIDIFFQVDGKLIQSKLRNILKNSGEKTFNKNKKLLFSVFKLFEDDIQCYLNHRKEEVLRYFQQYSFQKENIVFDLGYSGSVSRALNSITDKVWNKIYVSQTDKNRQLDKKYRSKTIELFPNFLRNDGMNLILEELFSPLDGSCIAYKIDEKKGIFYPVLENIDFNSEMKKIFSNLYNQLELYLNSFTTIFSGFLKYFGSELMNVDAQIALYDVAMKSSPSDELTFLENICFPDPIYETSSTSLLDKIVNKYHFENLYQGSKFTKKSSYYTSIPKLHDSILAKKIGIHIHLYFIELYSEFLSYLKDFPCSFDLFVTVTNEINKKTILSLLSSDIIINLNHYKVIVVPNKGRDIAPWLVETSKLQLDYDYFCHVHSKKTSDYVSSPFLWRKYLLDNLIEKDSVIDVLNILDSNKDVGIVFPIPYTEVIEVYNRYNTSFIPKTGEYDIVSKLFNVLNVEMPSSKRNIIFSMGSMFWYKPKALKNFLSLDWAYTQFPCEPIPTYGTLAHAIERVPSLIAQSNGYTTKMYTRYPNI